MRGFLPRTVIILGLVSFLNDTASEMITPLLPLFLTATLGAGPAIIGLVEGLAEATASILKLLSGWLVDRGWSAKKMVVSGYTISNSARPLIGFALGWGWVLLLRFLDRVGKGIRTAPRDALIASTTDQQIRGACFWFSTKLRSCRGHAWPSCGLWHIAVGDEYGACLYGSDYPRGHAYTIVNIWS